MPLTTFWEYLSLCNYPSWLYSSHFLISLAVIIINSWSLITFVTGNQTFSGLAGLTRCSVWKQDDLWSCELLLPLLPSVDLTPHQNKPVLHQDSGNRVSSIWDVVTGHLLRETPAWDNVVCSTFLIKTFHVYQVSKLYELVRYLEIMINRYVNIQSVQSQTFLTNTAWLSLIFLLADPQGVPKLCHLGLFLIKH